MMAVARRPVPTEGAANRCTVRRRRSGVRSQKSEVRSQKSEVRSGRLPYAPLSSWSGFERRL